MSQIWALEITDKTKVKRIKTLLEKADLLNKSHKIIKTGERFYLPVLINPELDDNKNATQLASILLPDDLKSCTLVQLPADQSDKSSAPPQLKDQSLKAVLYTILQEITLPSSITLQQLLDEAPTRYQLYEPLILFTAGSFTQSHAWSRFLTESDIASRNNFFKKMTTLLSKPQNSLHNNQPNTDMLLPQNVFTHVAENAPIADENDILRLPSKILPLYPVPDTTCMNQSADFDNLWVQTTQNGIRQTWAPGHTMFSRGNIKEKARVLEFAKAAVSQYEDQKPPSSLQWAKPVAVDLYAGIGYFTFSYAKAGFGTVLCWELNPWSIEGLIKGSEMNKWKPQRFFKQKNDPSIYDSQQNAHAQDNTDKDRTPVMQSEEEEYHKVSNFLYPRPDTQSRTEPGKNIKASVPTRILIFQEDNLKSISRLVETQEYTRQILNNTLGLTSTENQGVLIPPPVSHINLGLLPTTNRVWPTACLIAYFSSSETVTLHIHANLSPEEMNDWTKSTQFELETLMKSGYKHVFQDGYLIAMAVANRSTATAQKSIDYLVRFVHLEKIKTYAPGVWHICGDFIIEKRLVGLQ